MRRLSRFLPALLVIFAIDLIITMHTHSFGPSMLRTIAKAAVGLMPIRLPGNYFVSLILQLIFIAPLLYYSFRRSPIIALVATFAIDLGFELSGPYIPYTIYYISILRFIAALGVGFYIAPELLAKGKLDLLDRRFVFIVPLAILSAMYLVVYNGSTSPLFRPEWGTQNLLSFFWPMLLVILIFQLYSHISRMNLSKILELAGRASYHIFLVQMLYFGFVFSSINNAVKTMPLVVAWTIVLATSLGINIILGIIFYRTEGELREKVGKKCHRT